MHVTVFITKPANDAPSVMLVVPYAPKATVPRNLCGAVWSLFATTTFDDRLIGGQAAMVEADIARYGYALVYAG